MSIVTPVAHVPALGRAEAGAIAAIENERFVALVSSLGVEDWTKPTDCPAWDVRAMASHLLGEMEGNVSLPQFIHQWRAGNKAAGDRPAIDGMTEVQVRERLHLGPAELVHRLADVAPRAARARKRLPGPLRRMPMRVDVGSGMEKWSFGYLFDVIMTRDTWMHRVDISRATGRVLPLTAEHDGRIVADVVAEWARRHGQPFTLTLLGPAGGSFTSGTAGDEITIDAIEFCRTLSGRVAGSGLLGQVVPF
jgi:uncharacterized protein (TIGR03083 family)